MQHGQQRRHCVVRLIGMPEVVAPFLQPGGRIAGPIEVGDGVHRGIALAVHQAVDVLVLDLAEIQGEGVLLLLGQMLVAKHQDRM